MRSPDSPLALAYTEAAKPGNVFWRVVTPPIGGTSSARHSAETLAEPKPGGRYAEFFCGLPYAQCVRVFEHAHTVTL